MIETGQTNLTPPRQVPDRRRAAIKALLEHYSPEELRRHAFTMRCMEIEVNHPSLRAVSRLLQEAVNETYRGDGTVTVEKTR